MFSNYFDYGIDYRLDTPIGRFFLDTNAYQMNAFESKARPQNGAINQVGNTGAVRWRGRSTLGWDNRTCFASLTAKYINSFYTATTDPTPAFPTASGIDGHKIPHTVTWDLQVGARVKAGQFTGWKSVLNASEVRLTWKRAVATKDAFLTDNFGFYPRYEDPRGKYIQMSFSKSL